MRVFTWILTAVLYPVLIAWLSAQAARSLLGQPKSACLWVFEGVWLVAVVLGWYVHALSWRAWRKGEPKARVVLGLLLFPVWCVLVGGLGLAGYKLASLLGLSRLASLAVAFGASAVTVLIIFFNREPSRHVRGRRLLEREQARAIAAAILPRGDPGAYHGGVRVPLLTSLLSYLILGASRSGKTKLLQILMRAYLPLINYFNGRALVYDAKRDVLSFLDSLGIGCRIVTLNPRDRRCHGWAIGADCRDGTDAQAVAEILIPEDKNASDKYWDRAARELVQGVIEVFQQVKPEAWTLRDVICATRSKDRLTEVLNLTEAGRELVGLHLAKESTALDVVTTLGSKIGRYKYVAAAWHKAEGQGRTVSLEEWLRGNFILVLGNAHKARPSIRALNQLIFFRATQLLLDAEDIDQARLAERGSRRSFIFLDEIRHAGQLEGLNELFVEGASRGCLMFVGLQDLKGWHAVYGANEADEQISQAANIAVLRLQNEATAKAAASLIGQREVRRLVRSVTRAGLFRPRSVTVAEQVAVEAAVLDAEITGLPSTNPRNGLSGFFLCPDVGAWTATLPWKEVVRKAQGRKTSDLMANFLPWDDEESLHLLPWTEEERRALGLVEASLSCPEAAVGEKPGQGRRELKVVNFRRK